MVIHQWYNITSSAEEDAKNTRPVRGQTLTKYGRDGDDHAFHALLYARIARQVNDGGEVLEMRTLALDPFVICLAIVVYAFVGYQMLKLIYNVLFSTPFVINQLVKSDEHDEASDTMLKMIHQNLVTIRDNHLAHIAKDITQIKLEQVSMKKDLETVMAFKENVETNMSKAVLKLSAILASGLALILGVPMI